MKKRILLIVITLLVLGACSKKNSNQKVSGNWYTGSSSSTSASDKKEASDNSIYDIVLENLEMIQVTLQRRITLIMISMGMVRMNYFLDGTGSLREQLNLRLFIMIITE